MRAFAPVLAGHGVEHLEQQGRRSALELAQRRGGADARHRLARAIVVDQITERGGNDLGVPHFLDRRIFLVALPLGARCTVGEIPSDGERAVAEKARLAAGDLRLAGLPVQCIGLDRERLEDTQGFDPACGGNPLIDELAHRLRLRRLRLECGEQQCGGCRDNSFHCDTFANAPGLPIAADLPASSVNVRIGRQVVHDTETATVA